MATYRKKPVEVQAWRWIGTDEAYAAITDVSRRDPHAPAIVDTHTIQHLWDYDLGAYVMPSGKVIFGAPYQERCLIIMTLEGEMVARLGTWIIRGVQGEFYPCDADIFEQTYDVDQPPAASGPRPTPLVVGSHSGHRDLAITALSEGQSEALQSVIRRHEGEFQEALATAGVDWDTVLAPDYYRTVTASEARAALEGA